MDYFGSSGVCGTFEIVFLFGGPGKGVTNEVSNSPPAKD